VYKLVRNKYFVVEEASDMKSKTLAKSRNKVSRLHISSMRKSKALVVLRINNS
jgi:hypothetical protein